MSFTRQVVTLIAEDDSGHARLIEKNLIRSGLEGPVLKFSNGQQVLDFLFGQIARAHGEDGTRYVLLLDINMPQVNGVEVLRQVRGNAELRKMPIIMLTTSDDPREVDRCYTLGCSNYIVKPVADDRFAAAMMIIGDYISLAAVPSITGPERVTTITGC